MALSAKLAMRQGQAMVLTPQLLQAIKLLQMPNSELAAFIENELERNPLLDRAGDRPTRAAAGADAEPPTSGLAAFTETERKRNPLLSRADDRPTPEAAGADVEPPTSDMEVTAGDWA